MNRVACASVVLKLSCKMPYKIVETLEKGKRALFYVPNKWENNNILHWPKFKVETLMAIEDSQPDASWSTSKCRVKRTGLVSIASAEEELAKMCAKSDTESDEPENIKSKNVKRDHNVQNCFDEILKTCSVMQEKTSMSPLTTNTNSSRGHIEKTQPKSSSTENNTAVSLEYEKTLELQSTNDIDSSVLLTYIPSTSQTHCSYDENNDVNSMINSESQCRNVNESAIYVVNTPNQLEVDSTYNHAEQNDKIDNLIAISQTLSQNQFNILEYVKNIENKVLQKLSYISAQIDTFATVNSRNQGRDENVVFQIISNKEELQTFEENLALPEFRQGIKLRLESVCGKGKGRGVNNAYTLADIMFTRQFMTQCSWAGGSKNNTNKICFKIYSKTFDLFFEVIHGSDKDFSRKECEDFFKNIMRHALRRNKSEINRAPSCKRRRQKLVNVSQFAPDKEFDSDGANENVNQPTLRLTTNNNNNLASGNVSVASVAPASSSNVLAPVNLSVASKASDDI